MDGQIHKNVFMYVCIYIYIHAWMHMLHRYWDVLDKDQL